MIIKIDKNTGINGLLFQKCIALRKEVFVMEQQIDPNLEMDDKDEESVHYLLTIGDIPYATARYRHTDKGIKLERFAVSLKSRGKGYGKMLLERIIKDITSENLEIYLNAQESAVSFYLANGLKIVGTSFYEAGIRHFKMIYIKEKA